LAGSEQTAVNEYQNKEFLAAVEGAVYRYLAAGDQAYTQDGLSLKDMFARFETMDEVVLDFCKWYLKTRQIEHSVKHRPVLREQPK
jgi:hypothetical protein